MADTMEQLAFLVGTFTGTETIHPSAWAQAGTADVDVRCDAQLNGTILVQQHCERRADGEPFDAVNVFTRDPATGEVVLYSFDSAGHLPDPPARGALDGDVLVLDRRTARGESRTTYSRTDDGFTWSKLFRPGPDAAWQPVVDGELRRTDRPDR